MRDSLPPIPWLHKNAIINLNSLKSAGTHWVAYKKSGNNVLYFDSFGSLKPPQELVWYLGQTEICNITLKILDQNGELVNF